jgi:hypothetical protein
MGATLPAGQAAVNPIAECRARRRCASGRDGAVLPGATALFFRARRRVAFGSFITSLEIYYVT